MKGRILVAIEGYYDEPPFVIIVREGDEVGTRLVEGDEGFIDAIREIATVPHAILARQFLAQYQQHCKEAKS